MPPGFVRSHEPGEDPLKKGVHYDREKESERLDWDSRWSTPSLSPLNSGDLELDEDDDDSFDANTPSVDSGDIHPDTIFSPPLHNGKSDREAPITYAHRREVEALKGKQYWRDDWKGDGSEMGENVFDIGDASTLGEWRPGIQFSCYLINTPFLLSQDLP